MGLSAVKPVSDATLQVLLVEDDPAYARFVAATLDRVGSARVRHEHASSIRAGVQRLQNGLYDAVLLDLGLPDAQGLEALTTVVESAPDLPVVVLTGLDDEQLAIRAVQAGAQDYLPKGEATEHLLARSIRYAIERKQSELQMKRLAYRDSLTQLPNRILLMEHLDAALKRARRDQLILGCIFIDLDHFKQVNDTLGHQVGDEILRQAADRLRRSLRDNDILARLSGDEFVAVVEVTQRAALAGVAELLLQQLEAPFAMLGRELFITASVGMSSYPRDGGDAQTLLRNADRAMYRAKAEGRDTCRLYASRAQADASPKLELAAGLRRAIERNELVLEFQPLVDLRTQRIDGVEALVRWRHPSLGLIRPTDFIPIAEESGLILSIERWVLKAAMAEELIHEPDHPLKLAVNVSTRHFDHPALLDEVREITRAAGYDPRYLELELTERGLMHHPRRVLRHLNALHRLGIRVAVDDFGTGYSCLGLMKQFPLNVLKIDRSFVRNCTTDPTNRALVAAIIRMGHALGLNVTAEGVETADQLAYLREQGCDRAQGSYFSRPVPAMRLLTLLRSNGKAINMTARDGRMRLK